MKMSKSGTLSLRFGPMYSSKSTWINNELTIAADLGYSVIKIIHADDIRITAAENNEAGSTHNSSYNGLNSKIVYLRSLKLFDLPSLDDYQVIGIDEGTFFPDLYDYVKDLINKKKIVKVVGLDGDSFKNTFGKDGTSNILDLIPLADDAIKLTALCKICKQELDLLGYGYIKSSAPFTKRLVSTTEQKLIGGEGIYIPTCRVHHN